jgi:hypothetical protein
VGSAEHVAHFVEECGKDAGLVAAGCRRFRVNYEVGFHNVGRRALAGVAGDVTQLRFTGSSGGTVWRAEAAPIDFVAAVAFGCGPLAGALEGGLNAPLVECVSE